MKKLVQPNVTINFAPSAKQMELWDSLQPNRCDRCGGTLEMRANGIDPISGMEIYEPTCVKCGNTDIPELILGGGSAGGGKQGLLDSEVCTPFGFRKIRDLEIGSIITNPMTGGTQQVIWLHPIEKHPYYRVKFIDGTYFDCSEGHLWKAHVSSNRSKQSIKYGTDLDTLWTAKQMHNWYEAKKNGKYKGSHLIIPLTQPVKFTTGCHKPTIHPYILGALIGDGCITNSVIDCNYVQMTTMDQEIVDRFVEQGYDMSHWRQKENNRAKSYNIKDDYLIQQLRAFGIAGNRSQNHFIPKYYKLSSLEDRIQLMQGLIDTDGYVDDRGHITYTTTSEQLAEDVAFVVRSLGGVATITRGKAGYKKDGEYHQCCDAYDVQIRTKINPELCGLSRKRERARYEFNGGNSVLGKRIVDVEYIGIKEGRCISVSDPSGLYCCNDFTVTHNSYLGSAWLISTCMRFDNMLMVAARKTLKVLGTSTWMTIKKILREWGLVEDVNWHENNAKGYIDFWNGSRIMQLGLELVPSDPEFTWLGSIEISGAFVDEVSEISEKAIEVLASRIRHRIADTFIVGKTFLSTNPCETWVKTTFVLDEEEQPITVLPKGYRYIPFSLLDNPDPAFRATYYNKLSKIRDKRTRHRLLYGEWKASTDNKAAAYWNYDHDKHRIDYLWQKKYDATKPLIISVDFNVIPYMTCELAQIDWDNKKVYFLKEFIGNPKDKLNNTPAFSRYVAKQLKALGHTGGIVLTGDPAGLARSTQTEDGVNNFTIFQKNLKDAGLRSTVSLLSKQPAQITRLEFVNDLFLGFNDWEILIEYRNYKLVDDMVYQKKEPDGTKQKKKVALPSGDKAEQYGHASDCLDYLLIYFLNKDYEQFRALSDVPVITTIDNSTMLYNEFEY